MFLVGEPILDIGNPADHEDFHVPIGQAEISQQILLETTQRELIIEKLRQEYCAIIYGLKQMGINLRIIYSHPDKVDRIVLQACVNLLGCRLADFPSNYFPPSIAYPRDFSVTLPDLVLVNSSVAQVVVEGKDGYRIISSTLGEGGRVLACRNIMLVCERFNLQNGRSSSPEHLDKMTSYNIKTGLFPPTLGVRINPKNIRPHAFFNDHIDRIACLIQGIDDKPHLVIDPSLQVALWKGRNTCPSWIPLSIQDTLKLIKKRCDPLGIEIHTPKQIDIPYSLNFIQFSDGRVLMTSGDDPVAKTIADIVGNENVFYTEQPIRYFPFWKYAGIRCLVNEAPLPLLKSLNST